jgi:glycerol-3-phosphate acyltransferase PlsX
MKGNRMVQEAAQLMRAAHLDLDYHGYVEGDDISLGTVDVVVTDGFTGNVALKTAEGTAKLVGQFLKQEFTRSISARLSALLSRGVLLGLRQRMDPRTANGGVLLGLNGIVVKSHGGADGEGFATALRVARNMAASNFLTEIETNLQRLARVSDAAADQAAE